MSLLFFLFQRHCVHPSFTSLFFFPPKSHFLLFLSFLQEKASHTRTLIISSLSPKTLPVSEIICVYVQLSLINATQFHALLLQKTYAFSTGRATHAMKKHVSLKATGDYLRSRCVRMCVLEQLAISTRPSAHARCVSITFQVESYRISQYLFRLSQLERTH